MSDAAWGLSFGKFLELSFSNRSTANRIASCGHSLQRDCLRFYGYISAISLTNLSFQSSNEISGYLLIYQIWEHGGLLPIFSC